MKFPKNMHATLLIKISVLIDNNELIIQID